MNAYTHRSIIIIAAMILILSMFYFFDKDEARIHEIKMEMIKAGKAK